MAQRLTIGVDIGGTKVLAGVVDAAGRPIERVQRRTPHRSSAPEVVEDTIVAAVEELRRHAEVSAVGVGAAGFVDLKGVVRFAPHLSWRDEPLQAVLQERLGLPVVVDNDANTTARAEMRFGAGRGFREALCLTLGTGIGGAVVVAGDVVRGAQGLAGEFGHMQVVPDGLPCECGQQGCWEQYSSGRAIARVGRPHGGLDGPAVTDAARAGEGWALEAFEDVGGWLGVGLAGLVSALDPEIVIVGGGLSAAGDLLLEPARKAFAARLPGRGFRREPEILAAQLGPDAGFIGAATLARELLV
ncbi:MAG: ROK family glucokinase [Nocardioides sp.]